MYEYCPPDLPPPPIPESDIDPLESKHNFKYINLNINSFILSLSRKKLFYHQEEDTYLPPPPNPDLDIGIGPLESKHNLGVIC